MISKILIFTSDLFNLYSENTEYNPNEKPLGKDVAEYIKERLNNLGLVVSEVIEDTGGWVIDITIQKDKFTAYIHWAPLGPKGEKSKDFWVIQVREIRGFFRNLLGTNKKNNGDELETICNILKRILSEEQKIRNIRLINQDQFEKMY